MSPAEEMLSKPVWGVVWLVGEWLVLVLALVLGPRLLVLGLGLVMGLVMGLVLGADPGAGPGAGSAAGPGAWSGAPSPTPSRASTPSDSSIF